MANSAEELGPEVAKEGVKQMLAPPQGLIQRLFGSAAGI
jgi:hypothetical protein